MKIPITLQLVVLTVAMTGFYTMVGQSVPQKEVHPPEIIEIAEDVSPEEMVAIGKGIFEGKGICVTCHTIGKSGALRFPDLDGIATRAASRRPGHTAVDYLAESLYEPNIFIVDGYSPGMPVINKPPIGLTDQEILAVIAYLQTLGGEVTVDMKTKLVYTGGTMEGGGGGAAAPADGGVDGGEVAVASAGLGNSVIDLYGCTACHDAANPPTPSPTLKGIGSRLDEDQLLLKLYRHPGDDGLEDATLSELQELVRYMSNERSAG